MLFLILDFAFGRCFAFNDRISTDDLYRYGLEKEALSKLEIEIRRLYNTGKCQIFSIRPSSCLFA